MMDLHLLLKRLILASVGVGLVGAAYDLVFFDSLPIELQNYTNRLAEAPDSVLETYVALPVAFVNLLSLVFLWKLKRIGRTLFTASWIVSLVVNAGLMPMFFSSFGQMCVSLYILIDGLIFGLIYFSELRFRFEKDPPGEV